MTQPAGTLLTLPARLRRLVVRILAMLVMAVVAGQTVRDATRVKTEGRAVDAFSRRHFTTALRLALDDLDDRPRDRDAALVAARCLTALNYMDEAESCYAIAIATGPLETHVLHERALGLARADRRDAALECYDELIRRDPDDLVAVRRLATLLWSWGHSDEALSLAGRLVEDPHTAVVGHA